MNISDANKEIKRLKRRKLWGKISPWLFSLVGVIITYTLGLSYGEGTNLFNDKAIDVSSIFFGIFIGCLYLFEKFKNKETYSEFKRFCKLLLYLNFTVIALSFIVMLISDNLSILYTIANYRLNPKSLLFSIYVGLCVMTLVYMFRFVDIIMILVEPD